MNFSILIPHYKTGKTTAYSIAQLLKHKGKHEIRIIVVDNNEGDGSTEYLKPFRDDFLYVPYPKERLQSHGIGFDFCLELGYVDTDWFITMESDSFPTSDTWLDYYEFLINEGMDTAGSIIPLSGGVYLHPCGALYSKKNWLEAKAYCDKIPFKYFPNMALKEGFECHLMVHDSIFKEFIENPSDYIELARSYEGLNKEQILAKLEYYKPTCGVFHNGMGAKEESIKTYGQRNPEKDAPSILFDTKMKLIARIGFEPGQFFSYWHFAMNKKVAMVQTEIKWMPNRVGQQQEYTKMENGFLHIWAGSSFLDMKGTEYNDVYEWKKNQIDELYNSLPEYQKIKQ